MLMRRPAYFGPNSTGTNIIKAATGTDVRNLCNDWLNTQFSVKLATVSRLS